MVPYKNVKQSNISIKKGACNRTSKADCNREYGIKCGFYGVVFSSGYSRRDTSDLIPILNLSNTTPTSCIYEPQELYGALGIFSGMCYRVWMLEHLTRNPYYALGRSCFNIYMKGLQLYASISMLFAIRALQNIFLDFQMHSSRDITLPEPTSSFKCGKE